MPQILDTITDAGGAPLTDVSVVIESVDGPTDRLDRLVSASRHIVRTAGASDEVPGRLTATLEPGRYRMRWSAGTVRQSLEIEIPDGDGPYDIGAIAASQLPALVEKLIAWVQSQAFVLSQVEYDPDGVLSSAAVAWPDGGTGTLTVTSVNETWHAVDAFSVTYLRGGVTRTVIQPAVTRDADGAVTAQPTPTVA